MHKCNQLARFRLGLTLALLPCAPLWAQSLSGQNYQIFVSNEKSGDVTVISGSDLKVVATIPVGKRPRGIQVSPDGRTVYVAMSGTPIAPPPKLDADGNPIFQRGKDDDDDDTAHADKSADGIGVIDVAQRKLTGKLSVGSDPEEFSLSKSGAELYISNEDVKTASVIDLASGKVTHIISVGQEPEGVATAPDGKSFYVTCEAGGEIYVIDTAGYEVVDSIKVGARPWGLVISPDGKYLYAANGPSNDVSVVDLQTDKEIARIQAGQSPWGIVIVPNPR